MSLKYIIGQDELIASFVSHMVPWLRGQQGLVRGAKTIGIVDEQNELLAGLVFHNWDRGAGVIEISGAALPGRNWLTRQDHPADGRISVRAMQVSDDRATHASLEPTVVEAISGGRLFVHADSATVWSRTGLCGLHVDRGSMARQQDHTPCQA
jgi:hypothetical protein